MQIQCERCGAGYDLQLPPTARAGGRNLKFRCAACGHSFLVVRADGSRPEATAPVVARGYRVEEGAATRQVPDLATLQRLVASRELGPAARVTGPDGVTLPAQGVPELSLFFDLVRRAERGGAVEAGMVAGGSPASLGDASRAADLPSPATGLPLAARVPAAPAPDPGDLSWLDASMPSASEPETEALGEREGFLAALESVAPSPASREDSGSGTAAGGTAADDAPEGPADAPPSALDWMDGADGTDLAALEDLSWLDAPEPELPAPGGALEPPPASAPVPPGAAAEDVAWLEAANDALDGPGAAGAAGEKHGEVDFLDHGSAASSDASGPPPKGAATPAFDEDLAWLMDPALDAPDAGGAADSAAVPWDDGGSNPDGRHELPEEIRSLAAGLAVPAMPGPSGSGKGVFAKAPVQGLGADDEFWDAAVSLGQEDAATEEAPRPGVQLGDESNTMDIAGGSYASGSDDGFDDLDSESGGSSTGRWLAVAGVALLLAGGGWWWTTQPGTGGSAGPGTGGPVPAEATGSGGVEPQEPAAADAGGSVPDAAGAQQGDPPAAPPSVKPEPEAPAPAQGAPVASLEARVPAPPPKAAPAPAPAPRAAPPAPAGVQALVDRGWSQVDAGRLDEAGELFARAIQTNPTSGDAHFGAGYVAELRGSRSDAYREYCLAQFHGKGNVTLEREVTGRLRAIGRSCD